MTPWRYRHPYAFAAIIFALVFGGIVALGVAVDWWFGG